MERQLSSFVFWLQWERRARPALLVGGTQAAKQGFIAHKYAKTRKTSG